MSIKPIDILSRYYGYSSFRKGQENIINSILNKKDVLAIMPTGGGKSICYQVPALCLDDLTIVISPLISLMKDQVDALKAMGIEAAFINSSLSQAEYLNILNNINEDKYKLLYVAPERLDSREFIDLMRSKNISQLAIDEAHCISSWGHDFRKSYQTIPYFIKSLNKRPIVTAFTATASEEVRKDILNILELENPDVYITGFDRENLFINIVKSSTKNKYLFEYVENHCDESGIIYAATRKEVENIYEELLNKNYKVARYHAGLSNEEKSINQEKFVKDEMKIMVATNAFGMGIDKFNVRWVIHYNMPQSIENYYQEIGRAGRDNQKSEAILLFTPGDVHTQKYLIDMGIENPFRKKVQYEKLHQMMDLVHSNGCYRKGILNYFGEKIEKDCQNCSNCLSEGEVIDKTIDAQKVISCVIRMKRSFGINMIVDVLRGSKNKKVIDQDFHRLSTYGIMKNYSAEELKNFINTLVSHNYLEVVENMSSRGSYPTIRMNENSMKIIKNELKVEFKESKVSRVKHIKNELYERLVELRLKIAKENNLAPYMVFGDATLNQMVRTYATTKDEMLSISGVGEIKYERYGKEFEKIIKDYILEKNIDKNNISHIDSKDNDEFFEIKTDKQLLEKLKEYRFKKAKKENVPPYMILNSSSLKEISGRYPLNEEQLKDIGGIGPVKIEKYGKDIIEIVESYIKEKNITPSWREKKKLKLIIDGDNRKDNEIVLDLLNQNKNLDEINEELEIPISTSLGYVYNYIKEGNTINFNLNLKKYYSDSEKQIILNAIENFGENNIKKIKYVLPKEIKYESIRAVILEKYLS